MIFLFLAIIMVFLFTFKLFLLSLFAAFISSQDDLFSSTDAANLAFEEPVVVPIEQSWPPRHRANLDGIPVNTFGDWMAYWHFYPEIMGYVRHGNGRTNGDVGYWYLESDTNVNGRGSLFVEFPPKRNSVDANPNGGSLGAYDGLFHTDLRGFIRGYNFKVIPTDIIVNFGPEYGNHYTAEVPFPRATLLGHYVTFYGEPFKRYGFLLNRAVIWGDRPYPDHTAGPAKNAPVKKPVKDEL